MDLAIAFLDHFGHAGYVGCRAQKEKKLSVHFLGRYSPVNTHTNISEAFCVVIRAHRVEHAFPPLFGVAQIG